MSCDIRRIFVEKKQPFNVEAKNLLSDMRQNLLISELNSVRILNAYHISGITDLEFFQSKNTIFSEKTVDKVYENSFPISEDEIAFGIEYLPGQYDQRADSAADCVQLLTQGERPEIKSFKIVILKGKIESHEIEKVKNYMINPVDSREANLENLRVYETSLYKQTEITVLEDFIHFDETELRSVYKELNLAMTFEDLIFCQRYFRDEERRNPTFTEIKVIDTYWSDHCRHTTFLTELREVEFESGKYRKVIEKAFLDYLKSRDHIYGNAERPMSLMDIAVIGMKELRKKGLIDDVDLSDEINACSIKVPVVIDGNKEDWLVMFKNETHNHPTEIEPFGGAATCLGGAIRDPLSGRTYVYQAMRLTGSGDPRKTIEETLPGKLPQRKITIGAAAGYSSYGNQIGIATGYVDEVYDDGFMAKRMEIGAVIGAAPASNVRRNTPVADDKIILLGGRTGRDGCGGATGSSKTHTEDSITNCGAEVQKGNAPTERKIQRLFRNHKASKLIKRCNDFGAGGVSVAIGELADGLEINLDLVPKKYEGLDGTELAISESQERMAVVVSKEDAEQFIKYALEENLEATIVAEVNDSNRLVMNWQNKSIVDISREFLNTNGARAYAYVYVSNPGEEMKFFDRDSVNSDIKTKWETTLKDLNICSRKGLVERFDSTIGSSSVLMPFGGKYQLTPVEGMVSKIPVITGNTETGTVMTCGYNPNISKWSPFHGAVYSIVEAVTKIVALGGGYERTRLSLQEYFEKLGTDSRKWGKPFAALLGALHAQKALGIPAIGGKDSMSGSFNDIHVPPTLAAFAVCAVEDCSKIVSQEFKESNSLVILIKAERDDFDLPDFDRLKHNFQRISRLISERKVLSSHSVRAGGVCEAISKMCFGNKIGFVFEETVENESIFAPDYGSVILELDNSCKIDKDLQGLEYEILGYTSENKSIKIKAIDLGLEELIEIWEKPLERIFPIKTAAVTNQDVLIKDLDLCVKEKSFKSSLITRSLNPTVFIPVFPGTNCEYDTERAFVRAGANVRSFVFNNMTPEYIEQSVRVMEKEINNAQILMLPGGFSAGDEPEGSGKFIATVFRNPRLSEVVMNLIKHRDGLILGICNGFQALIKLGLVPYGEIREIDEQCPTLTFNEIGRHVSCMVNTKVVSKLSPWFSKVSLGDIHTVPVSHGEGRFICGDDLYAQLFQNGQIATQYVDQTGSASLIMPYNPNGSYYAVEGITSPDGRILGKMAHSERVSSNVHKNIIGEKDQKIFESGVSYFK